MLKRSRVISIFILGAVLYAGYALYSDRRTESAEALVKEQDDKRWKLERDLEVAGAPLKAFRENVKSNACLSLDSQTLSENFQARFKRVSTWSKRAPGLGVSVMTPFESVEVKGGQEEFCQWLSQMTSQYDSVDSMEWHVTEVKELDEPKDGKNGIILAIEWEFGGGHQDIRKAHHLECSAVVLSSAASHWVIGSMDCELLYREEGKPLFLQRDDRLLGEMIPRARALEIDNTAFVSVWDWDRDGDLDVASVRNNFAPQMFVNNGEGVFENQSKDLIPDLLKSGSGTASDLLDLNFWPTAMYFVDLNNSGGAEMVSISYGKPWDEKSTPLRIFGYRDDKFVELEYTLDKPLEEGPWYGATFADYDRDGLVDIYLIKYRGFEDYVGAEEFFDGVGDDNRLLRNRGGLKFQDVTAAVALQEQRPGFTLAASFTDFDSDGWPDLYVTNDFGANKLYRNYGGLNFVDESKKRGVEGWGNGMGATWVDYDNDQDLDLYVSNIYSYAGKRILESSKSANVSLKYKWAEDFVSGNSLFENDGNGVFSSVAKDKGVDNGLWAWGHLFFDPDFDGDLDLMVLNGFISNKREKDT